MLVEDFHNINSAEDAKKAILGGLYYFFFNNELEGLEGFFDFNVCLSKEYDKEEEGDKFELRTISYGKTINFRVPDTVSQED